MFVDVSVNICIHGTGRMRISWKNVPIYVNEYVNVLRKVCVCLWVSVCRYVNKCYYYSQYICLLLNSCALFCV